jgi:hypothetical protein
MRLITGSIVIAVAIAFAVTASAQPPRPGGRKPKGEGDQAPQGMIVKIQPEQIAKLFTDAGFNSKVVEMKDKSRLVQTEFWSGDVWSGAIPLVCEKDGSGCHGMMLFANLGKESSVNQDWINAWNDRMLYVRATNHKDALIFTWQVALLTGVTPDYIKYAASGFKYLVDQSTDFKP